MNEPELERKNLTLGWGLFALFVALVGLTFLIALLYLAVD